jgi:hypothetical protein
VQKKARLLIYTIDGSDEEKTIMDIGPKNRLAGLILVLSTGQRTADGNKHGSTVGESK